MAPIDLRSDTVTQPTPAMRAAMANAMVGDDVYGEDPTINLLQAEAAAMLGKEAGLFVTSGTQGNLTAVLTHCGRGDEIIIGKETHIFQWETGSAASYGGVHTNTLPLQNDGTMDLVEIENNIRPADDHCPTTRMICLENTAAGAWGAALSAEYTSRVAALAHNYGLKLHIDGARLFNAAAALRTPVTELVRDADSVTFCLSKGLCAPVGSVLVGSKEFIVRAAKIRKSLGGGMRQGGILAAAGLVALREMTNWDRLREDHENARALAEGLATIPCIEINLERVTTNMLFFALNADAAMTLGALSTKLAERRILTNAPLPHEKLIRLVTHYWFNRSDVEHVVWAMREILRR